MPIVIPNLQFQLKRSIVGLLILGSLSLLPACASSDAEDEIGSNVTTEELIDAPTEIAGTEVTIRSTVDQVLGDSVASINDPRIFSGGSVLVINNTGETFALPDAGVDIQLTGDVMETLTPELATDLKLNLDEEFYNDYRDKPVVIASSLALAPDPTEVSTNPGDYYEQVIAIEGKVDDIYGLTSFSLDNESLFGGDDVLVVGVPVSEEMTGNTVVVTGKLRPFIAADFTLDSELGWEADQASEIEAEFNERPVMVGDGIYPMVEQKSTKFKYVISLVSLH